MHDQAIQYGTALWTWPQNRRFREFLYISSHYYGGGLVNRGFGKTLLSSRYSVYTATGLDVYSGTDHDWNRTNCIDAAIASGSFFYPIANIQKEIQEIESALRPANDINTGASLLFRSRKENIQGDNENVRNSTSLELAAFLSSLMTLFYLHHCPVQRLFYLQHCPAQGLFYL